MDKRLLLAVALSIAFLVIWTTLFMPRQPPTPPGAPGTIPGGAPASGSATGSGAGSGTPGEARPAEGSVPSPATSGAPSAGGTPSLAAIGGGSGQAASPDLPAGKSVGAAAESEVTISTPLQEIRITNRGGRIAAWKLKKYLDDKGKPLDLVSDAGRKLDHLPLQFLLEDLEATRRLKQALYHVERADRDFEGKPVTEITLSYSDGAGLMATKMLRIDPASYLAELSVAAAVGGKAVTPTLVWGAGFGPHTGLDNGRFSDNPYAVMNLEGRVVPIPQAKVKPEAPVMEGGPITWAGLEDHYFAAIVLPQPQSAPGQVRVELLRLVEEGREQLFLSFALGVPGASHYHLFVGPKDYDLLKSLNLGLEKLLDFGWFGVIALPLFYALKFIEHYVGNFGWAIVLLTILIRLVFFPLMHRSQVQMRKVQEKMKRVQPKVKALRERYHRLERKEAEKGNVRGRHQVRQRMNEEMMELYKEEGINPLGSLSGCLPLLLQLPILYAFYAILTISIELRRSRFLLWITDLSQKDPYYVTPIIMGATMLVQQLMTSSSIPDPAQRRMMLIMPIMFTYFFINLPSGLVLYWLTSNLLGIAQQYFINREVAAESGTA
jgi:YidC/Oxa1 family membrane protein insertase